MNNSAISALEARIAALEVAQTVNAADDSEVGFHDTSNAIQGETGAFRIEFDSFTRKLKVCDCHFMFARCTYTINDTPLQNSDQAYWLEIPHSNPSGATIEYGSSMTTISYRNKTVVPLFEFSNGEIVKDYRGMPVIPVYETSLQDAPT